MTEHVFFLTNKDLHCLSQAFLLRQKNIMNIQQLRYLCFSSQTQFLSHANITLRWPLLTQMYDISKFLPPHPLA